MCANSFSMYDVCYKMDEAKYLSKLLVDSIQAIVHVGIPIAK